MVKDDKRRLIASLEIVTGVGLILFWAAFLLLSEADPAPMVSIGLYSLLLRLPKGSYGVFLPSCDLQKPTRETPQA